MSTTEDWIAPHQQSLTVFTHDIERCIGHADWEMLDQVLHERQMFLENLSALAIPDDSCKAALKCLLQNLLQQDAHYIAQIEAQKNTLSQQQASLETGRRAIQAYIQCR
jgi:Flagellar protein FliT